MSDRAVCLLSGGMDSAVAAAWAKDAGRDVVALTIDYGQRHGAELDAARAVAGDLAVHEHVVLRVDLRPVGGSALTSEQPVPDAGAGDPIPATYVPARNTLFLALALGLAEARDAGAIVIGANHVDYSGYPDCRPAFLDAFRALAAVATKAGVEGRGPEVQAPLLDLSKREIVRLGQRFGVPFARTVSCYRADDDGRACGRCDACRLRADGFRAAGVDDPTRYAE